MRVSRFTARRPYFAPLMVATARRAAAVPEYSWQPGYFLRARVPVYAELVDGWLCHLAPLCRWSPAQRVDAAACRRA
jgi:hypothetical protein